MPLRSCENGHQFNKTSDCPVCPICARILKPDSGFLALLSAPACRALQNAGIETLEILSEKTEKEILQLHGMGKASLLILRLALEKENLTFKQ